MTKEVSSLIGRVEKLDKAAPEPDADYMSAVANSTVSDLTTKIEDLRETVNNLADRLLDVERR
eukprot:1395729-Lingulodinium_polyedra.AAC.1